MPESGSDTMPAAAIDEGVDQLERQSGEFAAARRSLLAVSRAYLLGPVAVVVNQAQAPREGRGPSSAVIRKARQRQRHQGHRAAPW